MRVFRKRKGSLIVIMIFAVMIAIISFGTLSVASTLYAQNKESSTRYSKDQSYRAAIEIAVYQYCNELQSTTVTKSLAGDWISVTGTAIYTQSLEAIQDSIGNSIDKLVWHENSIQAAVTGATVSDPSIMLNLLALLNEGRTEFMLKISDYPTIDYTAGEGYISDEESYFKLNPLEVNVSLTVKGEHIDDILYVDGLYMFVDKKRILGPDGIRDTEIKINIYQGEGGLQIFRV